MVCVFCNTDIDEKVTKKDDIKCYVCGNCTQRLITTSQENLKKAYDLAIEKKLNVKAAALKSFMYSEEEISEREAKNKKPNYRKRAVRNNKKRPWETTSK